MPRLQNNGRSLPPETPRADQAHRLASRSPQVAVRHELTGQHSDRFRRRRPVPRRRSCAVLGACRAPSAEADSGLREGGAAAHYGRRSRSARLRPATLPNQSTVPPNLPHLPSPTTFACTVPAIQLSVFVRQNRHMEIIWRFVSVTGSLTILASRLHRRCNCGRKMVKRPSSGRYEQTW